MSKQSKRPASQQEKKEEESFPGYPHYDAKEDIYAQEEREEALDPDDMSKLKSEKKESMPGEDLDIPGAELDDDDEAIGEEDEENNYYSLGGDNHENLEEDQGED